MLVNNFWPFSTREVHILLAGGDEPGRSSKHQVGPKVTEMRFWLLTFDPQHVRSSQLVDGCGRPSYWPESIVGSI